MLKLLRIINGIYYIKQADPTHPLSVSNGFLLIPDLINGNNKQEKMKNNIQNLSNSDKKSRYKTIALDLNFELSALNELKDFCERWNVSEPDLLIMSHCHLDHSGHTHLFVKKFNADIMCPKPEVQVIREHNGFLKAYEITEISDIPNIINSYDDLKYNYLGFDVVDKKYNILGYEPGLILSLGPILIKSIPLTSHSIGHSGFIISLSTPIIQKTFPNLQVIESKEYTDLIIHSSCIGLDRKIINKKGFGPWYGFKQNSILQYFSDIQFLEEVFIKNSYLLTSSHGLIYSKLEPASFTYLEEFNNTCPSDLPIIKLNIESKAHSSLSSKKFISTEEYSIHEPFDYLRERILDRQLKIEEKIEELGYDKEDIRNMTKNGTSFEGDEILSIIKNLEKHDIIYRMNKIPENLRPAYQFWQRGFIINHLEYYTKK